MRVSQQMRAKHTHLPRVSIDFVLQIHNKRRDIARHDKARMRPRQAAQTVQKQARNLERQQQVRLEVQQRVVQTHALCYHHRV
jgi:hypothetical protein